MEKIKQVCVVGAGRMGREIALNAAVYGHRVMITDQIQDCLEQSRKWAEDYLSKSVEKGKLTSDEYVQTLANCVFTPSLEAAIGEADLVVECIIEDLDAKKALFRQMDALAPAQTILATNSSYLPSSRFAPCTRRPDKVVNLHYFNPAMRMVLVEIVRGEHVSEETVQKLIDFAKAIGKTAIIVNKEIEGFVVNRILKAVADEAFYLLDHGIASYKDIDLAAEKGLNYPLGPFRLMDLTGLDIAYQNRLRIYENTGQEEDRPSDELRRRFEQGEYGRKTGKGWYNYE